MLKSPPNYNVLILVEKWQTLWNTIHNYKSKFFYLQMFKILKWPSQPKYEMAIKLEMEDTKHNVKRFVIFNFYGSLLKCLLHDFVLI